jgi:hypothetical protein
MSMPWSLLATVATSPAILLSVLGFGYAQAAGNERVSGPIAHENLTIYFIHGSSAAGKVPLTLDEALAKGSVQLRETGNVNQLEIENVGDDEVFIQSGDIVKGGRQDRTLMVSLLLPPKSGRVAIASFCVEQGRWSARGHEDAKGFATASAAVPSRAMKLAMKAPMPAPTPTGGISAARTPHAQQAASEIGARQQAIWEDVRRTQAKLSERLGAPVNSAQSASSLQLALENEKLIDARRGYVKALKPAGEAQDDIVGYVFAVNGKLNSADIYPSNGLFRKMWAKLLDASAIEAIGRKDEPRGATPSIEAVTAFLHDAEEGKASQRPLTAGARLETREGTQAYYFETARATPANAGGAWVHRNYLAK